MIAIERALKNYLVNPNDLDLGFAMARLAELTKKYCRDLGCPLKKEVLVLSKTFSVDLKIGKWPEVLDGKFDPNFRAKTDAILKKKNGGVHVVAELMLKQCCDTAKKNAGFGK
jgi:hypothetical protein